jgi:hypothetical protein
MHGRDRTGKQQTPRAKPEVKVRQVRAATESLVIRSVYYLKNYRGSFQSWDGGSLLGSPVAG